MPTTNWLVGRCLWMVPLEALEDGNEEGWLEIKGLPIALAWEEAKTFISLHQ